MYSSTTLGEMVVDGMIRYELKKVFSKSINRILILILVLVAFAFSCLAIWSVTYVDGNGNTHNGVASTRRLSKSKSKYEGVLSPDVIKGVILQDRDIKEQYGSEIPDSVYAKGAQEYGDIKDLCVSILCYDKEFDESVLDGLEINDAGRIYEIRKDNIIRGINEYGITDAQKQFLEKEFSKTKAPFDYEPADSWKTMGLYATTYAIVLLMVIAFIAAGIFSEEYEMQADTVFFSTKWGRSKGTKAKIVTGLIVATVIYWLSMALLSLLSFGVMGVSGARSPIQIEYSYCIYNLTFAQRYLVILWSGYIGCFLAATIAMFASAKYHSSRMAICFPFVIFIVSPFIGRVLPFKGFFNVTPDQLLNVYNCIRLPLLYQFGECVVTQIPLIIVGYTIIAIIIIPLIYFSFNKYRDR